MDEDIFKLETAFETLNRIRAIPEDERTPTQKYVIKSLTASKEECDREDRKTKELYLGLGVENRGIYFDLQGNPIGSWEWHHLRQKKRHIGQDLVNGYRVSTIYAGVDFGPNPLEPPLIFETMIFGKADDGAVDWKEELYCERYSSEQEALIGHKLACKEASSYV